MSINNLNGNLFSRRARMMTGGPDYIPFEDPVMEQICANVWGDGIGLTYRQAARVAEIPENFVKDRNDITSFDELQYFTHCYVIGAGAFQNCSLTSIVMPPNLITLSSNAFRDAHVLSFLYDDLPKSIETIQWYCFHSCWAAWGNVDLPNLKSLGAFTFGYTGVINVTNLGSINHMGDCAFEGGWQIDTVTAPNTLTDAGLRTFKGASTSSITYVVLATTPPIVTANLLESSTVQTFKIYVPYSSDHSILNAYKTTGNWTSYANNIYELNPDGTFPITN